MVALSPHTRSMLGLYSVRHTLVEQHAAQAQCCRILKQLSNHHAAKHFLSVCNALEYAVREIDKELDGEPMNLSQERDALDHLENRRIDEVAGGGASPDWGTDCRKPKVGLWRAVEYAICLFVLFGWCLLLMKGNK